MSSQRESNFASDLLRFLTLGKSEDLRTVLTQALHLGISISQSQAGAIWLYDGRSLKQVSFLNVPDYDWLFNQVPSVSSPAYDKLSLGKGLSGTCFVRQKPVISDDLAYDELTVMTPRDARQGKLRACAAVPIGFERLTVGVMTVFRSTSETYEPHVVRNLCLFGTEIALCLHHCICFPGIMAEWERLLSEYDPDHKMGQPVGQQTRPHSSNPRGASFPKGIQPATLGILQECFENSKKPLSCNEVAEITGFSAVTVRRYLNYMVKANILCQRLQYGEIGRPAFVYFARQ
ncbi:MAG TPA: GAF domain-containing protein [Firmicutes bacterium]|nr:GAF domain-containing protein [Candidatus Fermentithermobacillaceae bacterium]